MKEIFYTLWLITQPDIMVNDTQIHGIKFESQEDCLYMAKLFRQPKDPIINKKNCAKMTNYFLEMPIPLARPENFEKLLEDYKNETLKKQGY